MCIYFNWDQWDGLEIIHAEIWTFWVETLWVDIHFLSIWFICCYCCWHFHSDLELVISLKHVCVINGNKWKIHSLTYIIVVITIYPPIFMQIVWVVIGEARRCQFPHVSIDFFNCSISIRPFWNWFEEMHNLCNYYPYIIVIHFRTTTYNVQILTCPIVYLCMNTTYPVIHARYTVVSSVATTPIYLASYCLLLCYSWH